MIDILTVGEPLLLFASTSSEEIKYAEEFKRYVAGSELNVSVGLARLGYRVAYITKLGKDPFGEFIFDFLKRECIDTSHIYFDESHLTGLMFKGKKENGDPQIFYFRRNSAASHICKDDLSFVEKEKIKVVHLTGIPLALSNETKEAIFSIANLAKERQIILTVDPNLRPQLWKEKSEMIKSINDLAFMSDIFLPGFEEAKLLCGSSDLNEIASFYLEQGVKTVVVKLGEKGAFVSNGGESYHVPSFKVSKVVDTVGAGDGFSVGIISGIIDGLPLKASVVRANAIGAMQVMSPGDNDGLPDRKKLERFLEDKDENGF